jgi:hypothetical protein
MICCLKDTARQQRERKREKKEIVERKRKESLYVCSYPTKSSNRRTSKMSFVSTAYFLIPSSIKRKKTTS